MRHFMSWPSPCACVHALRDVDMYWSSSLCVRTCSQMLICTHRGPQPRGVKYQADEVRGISSQTRDPPSNCSSFSHLAGLSRGGVREAVAAPSWDPLFLPPSPPWCLFTALLKHAWLSRNMGCNLWLLPPPFPHLSPNWYSCVTASAPMFLQEQSSLSCPLAWPDRPSMCVHRHT